jgi:5'-nucleotidase/UDP-sugar diphosphatase
MTGTLYHTLYNGEADAALMNTVCFDAFELGNHEFDEGDAGLRRFLDHLRSGQCRTTVLAANVEPAIGSPLAPADPE